MQKDNCTAVCTKNNTRQSTQQIQEIIFNVFLLLRIYQPTFETGMISFSIAPLINVSMGVIDFLLRDLISHKQEKPLSHKYGVGI